MSVLSRISSPKDLTPLSRKELIALAAEIRDVLVDTVSQTGGHLGPNLGVVELTIALHRVFDSPTDPIIFDTGHQCYVHKLLTGRQGSFESLRQSHGLSGYPSRAESEHDWVENSHASASLSWAEGLAKAKQLRGEDGTVVAVIGDGALTGGMAWEALNNIAVQEELPLVIVVNDNGRSYTPTVGGIAAYLDGLRTDHRYEETLKRIKSHVTSKPIGGKFVYSLLHGFKSGVKDVLAPQGLFSDLGIKYLGPIDGHAIGWLERTLAQAKGFGGPVIVHCITHKGRGYQAAENCDEDRFHAVGKINAATGKALTDGGRTGTAIVRDELVALGRADDRIVALTAAMMHPTGLDGFAQAFPERTFDVGIAEQHALASAAGLASGGLHPVVALYATFLNRAFDQVLFDVGLHGLPVTILLDRAGVTGPDGASHHGVWDLSLLGLVPGLQIAAPWDEKSLRLALRAAVTASGPTAVRYSKDPVGAELVGEEIFPDWYRWTEGTNTEAGPKRVVLGLGAFAELGVEVAQNLGATAVSPLWLDVASPEILAWLTDFDEVISIEDGCLSGGFGSRLTETLPETQVRAFGLPRTYLRHASRAELLDELGLTAPKITAAVLADPVR